nr:putative reverse transcriptase domain-containing protein [Tanacetum cinerariifolium]
MAPMSFGTGVKVIIMVNVIPPDHVDEVLVVEPNQHDDVPEPVLVDEDEDPEEDKVEEEEDPQEEEDDMEIDIEEDENEPYVHKVGESSDALFLREDNDSLLPGLMKRDINSLFGWMASISRQLCGRETAHALVEKKGKAKDKFYGKLILEMGITPLKSAPMTQVAIFRMIKDSVDASITAERARQANVRNDACGSGPVRGQDATPAVCECTFAGFMKCNPAVFRSVEGSVKLQRWVEKTESVFKISECAKGKKIISQSGLLDSEWVREVLGLSPNVGLEALAESLNIPEGSQDKDSLKVLTELPRSQSMKVLALLVGSLVIVVMKNEGALLHFHDMGKVKAVEVIAIVSREAEAKDSEWVREVLGLSPNVGLEALAESLNIPEGSQDKDSLKVLTELPLSQSMKVLALLVGSLVIVVMKNEGALLHFHDMGKDHGIRKRKKRENLGRYCCLYTSGVDSELRLNRKQQAASTTPKAVSSATKAKRAAVAYSVFQLHRTGRGPYLL